MAIDKDKIMIIAAVAGFILILVLLFLPGNKEEDKDKRQNAYAEVPQANTEDVSDSKVEAYTNNRNSAARVYWSESEELDDVHKEDSEVTSEDIFGKGDSSSSTSSSRTVPTSNPYRESHQEREERHRRRQEEAIELAERMTTPEEDTVPEVKEDAEAIGEENHTVISRKTSAISSLDITDDSGGVSSLDSEDLIFESDESHPFRCMFARESRVKNGQRVSIILLEDIVISGTLVPKNTHLMATCKLSGRLELEIENIDMGGRILHLGYEAYDVDGSKGIYCPDVSSAGKSATTRGTNILGSNLTRRLGRISSEVVSTGISIVQSASGEVTVSVPAGYEFYIVKQKK